MEKLYNYKALPDEEFRGPRERMQSYGARNMSDGELLSIMLGSGTKSMPIKDLTEKVKSLIDVHGMQVGPENLAQINGMGPAKSLALCASLEYWRRLALPERQKIRSPKDATEFLNRFIDRQTEHFLCLCLNGAHELQKLSVISIGTLNKTLVHPREVFLTAIETRAASIIVAHNHPSGNPEPSPDDIETTKRLVEASKILGIPILDHIIFAERGYYSFIDHGKM